MTDDEARKLIQECFRELIDTATTEGVFVPEIGAPASELAWQTEKSRDRVKELETQIKNIDFDSGVRASADRLLRERGVQLTSVSASRTGDLLSGIARALVEQQHWYLFRLQDRLGEYSPKDSLFEVIREPELTSSASLLPGHPESPKGPSLGYAISRHLADRKKKVIKKTWLARTVQLGYLEEHLGSDRPLGSITAHDIRGYRDAICTLRANHGRSPKQSFAAKQTDNPERRIAEKTAKLIYETAKSFFSWACNHEALINDNPAKNVGFSTAAKPKDISSRRPFHAAELEQIFSAPIFTGCHSKNRRYQPGFQIFKDAKFWLPILGYYTGARLGELVQLHLGDIVLGDGIPHLSINEKNDNTQGAEKKHVKSRAGIRKVPLHPDVIELGFAEFVLAELGRKRKPTDRLFPEFPYGSDGQASTVASKWFRRFLRSIGLTDPAAVFHSYRHGAEDAFRNSLVQQYVIDRIIGHSVQAVSAIYGQGVSLDVMYDAVKNMKMEVNVPKIICNNVVLSPL